MEMLAKVWCRSPGFSHSWPTHPHKTALILPRQCPQKRPDIRAFVEEADRVDADAGEAVDGTVPDLLEILANVLAEDFALFGFLQLLGLFLGQRFADVGQPIGKQVDRVEAGTTEAEGGFECGVHVCAAC